MTRRRRRTRRKSALIKSNNPHLAGDSQVLTITIVFKLHIYIYIWSYGSVKKKKKTYVLFPGDSQLPTARRFRHFSKVPGHSWPAQVKA
jgi:hypothetical protein